MTDSSTYYQKLVEAMTDPQPGFITIMTLSSQDQRVVLRSPYPSNRRILQTHPQAFKLELTLHGISENGGSWHAPFTFYSCVSMEHAAEAAYKLYLTLL